MMIPGFGSIMMIACAVFYYHVGDQEYSSGILLAGVSIALWFAAGYYLSLGWFGCILVQVGLFVVLTMLNVVRDKIKR